MYALTTRLLDSPDDRQLRNITFVTRVNFALMRSLGIRYLITDFPVPEPARLTTEMVAPKISHFLFELPDPNYGRYSPVEIIPASDAAEVVRGLAEPHFDFGRSVFLKELFDGRLQPAQTSLVTFTRGGWRVQAQSSGISLLLLPFQFSNCLSITRQTESSGNVIAVQRANLVNTAIIFEGRIDVRVALRVSPFWKPYCRLQDAREMKEFGLSNIPRALGPVRSGGT